MNQKAQPILLILCIVLTTINTAILTTNFITAQKFITRVDKLIVQMTNQLMETMEGFNVNQPQATSKSYVFIPSGTYTTFLLKDKAVVVIDSMSFAVESEVCKTAIERNRDKIMDALMTLFMRKSKIELSTPSGIEALKSQIKDTVNRIIGLDESNGVKEVYLYIKAVSGTD